MPHCVLGTAAGAGALVPRSSAARLFLCQPWPFKGLSPNRLLDAHSGAVTAPFSRVFNAAASFRAGGRWIWGSSSGWDSPEHLCQHVLHVSVFQDSLLSTEETAFLNGSSVQRGLSSLIHLGNLSGFNGLGPRALHNKLYFYLLEMLIIFL